MLTHASEFPHLQVPEVQVSVFPEQGGLVPHLVHNPSSPNFNHKLSLQVSVSFEHTTPLQISIQFPLLAVISEHFSKLVQNLKFNFPHLQFV